MISEYGIYVNSEAIAEMNLTVPADVAARMTEAKDA